MPVLLLLDDFCDILYVLQYSVDIQFEMFLEVQGVGGILSFSPLSLLLIF